MISSELPEVLGMADRVLVVCEGRITAELDRADATPESVMHAATAPSPHARPPRPSSEAPHERTDLLVEPSRLSPASAPSPACSAPARSPSLACWSLLVVATTIKSPTFLFSHDGWRDLLLSPSLLLLLAIGADGRDHHPQRRPVRRLDPRADGLRHRQALRRPPGHPDRGGLRDRARCSAPLLGLRQRRSWSTAVQGAGPGDHPRHALHLPRHPPELGRQQPDQRLRHAGARSWTSAPSRS